MDGIQNQITGLIVCLLAWRWLKPITNSPMPNLPWRRRKLRSLPIETKTLSFVGTGIEPIPDYVEPVVAYRTWCWEANGIRSFNGKWWKPGVAFKATCSKNAMHIAPARDCTCGVYAGIDMQHMINIGYIGNGLKLIHGEVYLWGRLYKHTLGWRAQYAYPKSFVIPPNMMPWSLGEVVAMVGSERQFETLAAYDVDIYLQKDSEPRSEGDKVPLWTMERGWCREGLAAMKTEARLFLKA